ncbi:MAG: hypothetical protein JWR83_1939 [Aeromicrobium sp.]|nr:hypothetical protein [Aeromicrobium sp.]
MTLQADLLDGDLVLASRISSASNATYVGHIGDVAVVYKPVAGERPLWDFPDGNLAHREVAAYALSETLGWNLVPQTWLRDGPMGVGMVQLWREPDPEQEAVTLVAAGAMPPVGWCHVLDGLDLEDRPISLIHEDSAELRRMAVFDIITNNADRKGGHVLEMVDGHRHGVDHGLTFHSEHKLRTILWGWTGKDLDPDELAGVERVLSGLYDELGDTLAPLLSDPEIDALATRCEVLLGVARFPAPRGQMPAVPWPPF